MNECKIAEKLTELRTAKGLTQEEVAQSLSISNKTVSKWENGTSMPDLPMLAELSKFFGVTTDLLLGLSEDNKQDLVETISSLFYDLDREETVHRTFDLAKNTIPAIFNKMEDKHGKTDCNTDSNNYYPQQNDEYTRSMIAAPDIYDFVVNSDEVNCAVMLLRNKSNFAWLNDPQKQKEIVKLFRFLSREDALSVLYFIHTDACSVNFTADYIAKNTDLDIARASEVLDEFCKVGACRWSTAHLYEGDLRVYECSGDGILLSLISLAYEKMLGKACYYYCRKGSVKMIGGK